MNLRMMNEAFKRNYSDVLTEAVDLSCKESLRKELKDAAMSAVLASRGMPDMAKFKKIEIALQDVLERNFPDHLWWEVTSCSIFWDLMEHQNANLTCDNIIDKLKPGFCEDESPAEPEFVDTRKQAILSGDPAMDNGVDLVEAVSNPERTIGKVDRNLAKEVDKDLVRDLTLILENEGEVYRRSIVPVINNLKKKRAKGQFDEKLAIQAFFHVVEGALKQPWFYRYYSYSIATVSVPERYAVAKELLDGFMEEIEWDDTHKNENLSISKIRK